MTPSALRGNVISPPCPACGLPWALHEDHGCQPICLECRRPLSQLRLGAEAGCKTCLRQIKDAVERSDDR